MLNARLLYVRANDQVRAPEVQKSTRKALADIKPSVRRDKAKNENNETQERHVIRAKLGLTMLKRTRF